MRQNKKIIFLQKPESTFPQTCQSFKLVNEFIDSEGQNLKQGQFLVQVLFVSIDPVMRVWLQQAKTYFPALKKNDTMHCFAISKVLISKNDNFKVNDILFGNAGVQQYAILDESNLDLMVVQQYQNIDLQLYVNLVNNGLAAYMGINICALKENQTLVVSTAAGATEILACQIAKLQTKCRVVGLTGSQEKCEFLRSTIDIDCVLNYNDKNFIQELKLACPKGIDAYFDNIGEEMLSNILQLMNNYGRVALCGAMSAYGEFNKRKGVEAYKQIIFKRILIRGFAFTECIDKFDEIFQFFDLQISNKILKIQQTVFSGIESYPKAVQHLFQGKNIGKVIVKIYEDQKQISPKL